VYIIEQNSYPTVSGPAWNCNEVTGNGHNPDPTPLQLGPEVGALGSPLANGYVDNEYSGLCNPPPTTPYVASTNSVVIPTDYAMGPTAAPALFESVTQLATLSSSGALQITKNGAIGNTTVLSPTSQY